jgi:F420-dependent hydroxymycolic acid dehydrogenase
MVAIGFVLSHEQFPVPRLLDLGVAAEKAGFDMVWTSDHFLPWQDNQGHVGQAWITLAALGQKMGRIAFGTGVTCPTYRYHPAIVAQAFATLGLLYPGRVFLGVGTGEAINEQTVTGQWENYQERANRLVEAVQLIRRLWSGEWVTHQGAYYTLNEGKIYDLPNPRVPIYIAAEGPKSMYLAGQYGDGLISDSETILMPEMRAAFEEGARAAGKDPQTMPKHAESFVFVGRKEQAHAAIQKWRFLPKAWKPFVNNPDPRDIQRQAEAEISDEEVLQKWVVGDDADTHIAAIGKLIDGGVTHVYIHSGQDDQQHVIDFYARQVLPHFQHQQMHIR